MLCPFLFLTHVASQLLERYFPEAPTPMGPPAFSLLFPQDEAGWLSWIDSLSKVPSFPWVSRYFSDSAKRRRLGEQVHLQVIQCAEKGISIISKRDPRYPAYLFHIPDPPLCIFAQGNLDLLQRPCVSVVGSRRCSREAGEHAYQLGKKVVQQGGCIVSGGAYGCDIRVHQGVLDAGIRPTPAVVVFAGGFPHWMPQGNLGYFREILGNGGLFLTEKLWDHVPRPRDFPVRNRIISGLSPVTVVVQAGIRSGSMITARVALDQGREVLVFSYSPEDPWAEGNHALMAEGAESVDSVEDFFRWGVHHGWMA